MKTYFIGALFMVNLLSSVPAIAASLLPINLQQLSQHAHLIFYAQVSSNRVDKDKDSGHIATFTNFEVIETIKGTTSNQHSIKQLGGLDQSNNINFRIHGVPKFETGKRYVVFLPEKSKLGFSSPLGLHQGSFSVVTENGEQIVSNGRKLADDTIGKAKNSATVPLAVDINKPSQARLNDFINTVRAYNN